MYIGNTAHISLGTLQKSGLLVSLNRQNFALDELSRLLDGVVLQSAKFGCLENYLQTHHPYDVASNIFTYLFVRKHDLACASDFLPGLFGMVQ